MILCKNCFKFLYSNTEFDKPWEEATFNHYQWADATEDFNDPHGRFCDMCGREFNEGERVVLTEGDMSK